MKPAGLRPLFLSLALTGLVLPGLAAEKQVLTTGRHACSSDETWTFGSDIREEMVGEFKSFLTSEKQLTRDVRGFSQAFSLRKFAQNDESKYFGEYWIARSLYQAGLFHIAHSGFASIASKDPTPELVGIQSAALECLLRIEERYPTMSLPQSVVETLPQMVRVSRPTKNLPVAWEAVHQHLRVQLSQDKVSPPQIERSLALLAGGGAYETLGKALWAAKRQDHTTTVRELRKFFEQPVIPAPLKRYVDSAHITNARALYSRGDFVQASDQFKLVSKRSNELANSLSELSWAYLMNERYSEAIGTAMNLQAGGLRHTFTPEGPMVMSMALNELCQFPESLRAANLFKKFYEQSYRWLTHWNTDTAHKDDPLYGQALDYLKKSGKVPERIASEWVRSPTFISSQDEINLLFEEKEGNSKLGRAGAKEQRTAAREAIRMITEVKPKLRAAKSKQKPGEPLPKSLVKELRALKTQLTYLRRVQHAAPVWRAVLANYKAQAPGIKTRLLAQINEDLKIRTNRMIGQLDEIAENIQLIEVEIYNGASQDIIWQNAHPEYKQIAQQMKQDRAPAADKVWDWGHSKATADENTEIWEDELGSFKADLFDNCSSKDKFLALKMKGKHL